MRISLFSIFIFVVANCTYACDHLSMAQMQMGFTACSQCQQVAAPQYQQVVAPQYAEAQAQTTYTTTQTVVAQPTQYVAAAPVMSQYYAVAAPAYAAPAYAASYGVATGYGVSGFGNRGFRSVNHGFRGGGYGVGNFRSAHVVAAQPVIVAAPAKRLGIFGVLGNTVRNVLGR